MQGSGAVRRRTGAARPAVVALVATLAGMAVRVWAARGRDPVWWPDSDDYHDVASNGPLSLDLWAGARPPGLPLLLWLVGEGDGVGHGAELGQIGAEMAVVDGSRFVTAQLAIASVCWALLAASLCSFVASPRLRWVVTAVVVATSWTLPVIMWERSVLTESLSMSSLVLLVAAALQLVRNPRSWAWTAATLGALSWWVSFRDSHAAVLLGTAVVVAAWLGWRWRSGDRLVPRQYIMVLAGGCLVAALTLVGASHGNRSETPLRNLYAARVLPYEDRLAWFEDQGMPQVDEIAHYAKAWPVEPGMAPVVYIGEDDPVMEEWNEWLGRHGRSSYLRWVVTNPAFLFAEPTRQPERAFNNADGDRSLYAPYDQRNLALVSDVLTFSTAQMGALALGAAAVGLWAARRSRASSRRTTSRRAGAGVGGDPGRRGPRPGGVTLGPCFLVGLALAVSAVPHGLLAWHGDAMETARHVAIPAFQLQLGAGLLVVGAAVAVRATAGATSGSNGQLGGDSGLRGDLSLAGLSGPLDRSAGAAEHPKEMPVGASDRGDDAVTGVVQTLDAAEATQLPAVADGAVDEDHGSTMNEPDY